MRTGLAAALVAAAPRLARALTSDAPAGLEWHYQPVPEEEHGTICHPAALEAVRVLFTPGAGR